jgi:hypothetical protein
MEDMWRCSIQGAKGAGGTGGGVFGLVG